MRGSVIALRIAQKKVKELEARLNAMQEWLSPETMAEMEKHGWVFE